jgi:carbamoyl-phosphate synthase large subunit
MEPINVLITAASRRVSLIRNFRIALEGTHSRVIAVDFNIYSPALYFAHRFYTVPLATDSLYFKELDKIIKKEKITLIIPTIDDELILWAERKKHYAGLGITVSVSSLETVTICNDKWLTYQFFSKHNIPFPKTFLPEHLTYHMEYPLFIKPKIGRGSVNSFIVTKKKELDFFVEYVPDPIIQDYLKGKEFTVDAFFSNSGQLISCIPRYRLVIRSGVSDRGRTFRNDKLLAYIKIIGEKMKFMGAVNIQGKIYKEEISFFEINPRFSGGIQLSTAAGPNFAELIVNEMRGKKLDPRINKFKNNLTMTSYEDSLFINTRGNIRFFFLENPEVLPRKNLKKL